MITLSAEELRNKYYAGDASLVEEKQLLELLLAPNAPDEWKAEGQLLQQLRTPALAVPPKGFERRLLKRLEQEPDWQAPHARTTVLPFLKRLVITTAIAASLVGIFFAIDFYSKPALTVYEDTCQNAEAAEMEVENALLFVASTLAFDDMNDELGGPCE
jgi:hypothetical protein